MVFFNAYFDLKNFIALPRYQRAPSCPRLSRNKFSVSLTQVLCMCVSGAARRNNDVLQEKRLQCNSILPLLYSSLALVPRLLPPPPRLTGQRDGQIKKMRYR